MIAALSYYVFSLGSPGVDLSYTEMFAVMVIICLFIALPSVPGFWGLWEAGGVFAMSLFGISKNAAAVRPAGVSGQPSTQTIDRGGGGDVITASIHGVRVETRV